MPELALAVVSPRFGIGYKCKINFLAHYLITMLFLIHRGPNLDGPGGGDSNSAGGSGGGGDSLGDGPGPSHRPHPPPPSSSVMKKTAQQIAGERVLSRVVEEVEGISFSFK